MKTVTIEFSEAEFHALNAMAMIGYCSLIEQMQEAVAPLMLLKTCFTPEEIEGTKDKMIAKLNERKEERIKNA